MSNPTADDLKTMDFVFGGQPFVRAAVFSGSLSDTRSLDYVSDGASFVVQTLDEPLSVAISTAIPPGLNLTASLGGTQVANSTAPEISLFPAATVPNLTGMSFVWRGAPFVRAIGITVDTKSLDFIRYGEPFVTPMSASADISVSVGSAPDPGLRAALSFSHVTATATAQDPALLIFSGITSFLTGMSYVRQGQPFVRAVGIAVDTKSLDYFSQAQPFLAAQTLTSDISVAPATIPGTIRLNQNLLLDSPTIGSAFAVDPAVQAFSGQEPNLLSMSYVRRGQPFVRAAVFNTETKSLDYISSGEPFVAPDSFTGDIAVCPATAHNPVIVYNVPLQTATGQATAPTPTVKLSISFNPQLKEMSFTWQGQPFVRTTSEPSINTESLDYVYGGTSYVALYPASTQLLTINLDAPDVSNASAPDISIRQIAELEAPDVAPAAAGSVEIEPGIQVSATSAEAFAVNVLLNPLVTIDAVLAQAATTDPSLENEVVVDIAQAVASAGSLNLVPQVFLSAAYSTASCADPNLQSQIALAAPTAIAGTTAPQLQPHVVLGTAVSSASASEPSLQSNVIIAASHAEALAFALSLEGKISLDTPVSDAFANSPSLLPVVLVDVAPASASTIDLSVQVGVEISPAASSATTNDFSLLQTIVLQQAAVSATAPALFVENDVEITPAQASAVVQAIAIISSINIMSSPAVAIAIAPLLPQEEGDERPARYKLGQSGTKRKQEEKDEAYAWAKLLRINEVLAGQKIEGHTKVRLQEDKRVLVTAGGELQTRKLQPDIKIKATRVR